MFYCHETANYAFFKAKGIYMCKANENGSP